MATTPFSPFELTKYRIAASIDPAILPIIHPEHFSTGLKDNAILGMLGMPIEGEEEGGKGSGKEERSVSESSYTHPVQPAVPQNLKTTSSTKSRSEVLKKANSSRLSKRLHVHGGGKWTKEEIQRIQKHIDKKIVSDLSIPQYIKTFVVVDFPNRSLEGVRRQMERQASATGLGLKDRFDGKTGAGMSSGAGFSRDVGQDGDHEDDASSQDSPSSSSDESDRV